MIGNLNYMIARVEQLIQVKNGECSLTHGRKNTLEKNGYKIEPKSENLSKLEAA